MNGALVISLDFELHWGVRETRTLKSYGKNLLGVRKAIPALLELFREREIHATWATVGFLFFGSKSELMAACPTRKPRYADPKLSPYPDLEKIGADENADPYHYGLSLLRLIKACPGQEIGSHSFSHYYCLEAGPNLEDFRADIQSAKTAAAALGITLESFVFPRNQFSHPHLDICRQEGFLCYRGNPNAWFYGEGDNAGTSTPMRRVLRLLDSYIGISGPHCYKLNDGEGCIPASRFLRPYSRKLRAFEFLRLHRITAELTYAARHGLMYHLWWHPHNFGAELAENMRFLGKVLDHFRVLRQKYGMRSLTMRESAGDVSGG